MKIPKVIALYLPQFHEVAENNKWWGKGFTEWISVKKAKPLFGGHIQPKKPLNNNYYDLLDIKTFKNQSNLMKKYGIDGLCFYHYWFKGRKILEKPLELLLKNKDIELPFFFSWGNHTWSRTWYGRSKETLILQEYGDEKDWNIHFNYLLDFFKDERYIKVDNCPVLSILQLNNIEKFDELILFFNKKAKENGYNGIHIIETLSSNQKSMISNYSKSCFLYEPGYTLSWDGWFKKSIFLKNMLRKIFKKNIYMLLNIFDYNKIYKYLLSRDNKILKNNKQKINIGCFVDFDDTARRFENAILFNNANPINFKKYFAKVIRKAIDIKSDFIFITAWNEWGEGAYLEPDKKNGFGYLESIKEVKGKLQ